MAEPQLLPIPPQRPTPDWIAAMPQGLERAIWLRRQECHHVGYWNGPVGQARLRAQAVAQALGIEGPP